MSFAWSPAEACIISMEAYYYSRLSASDSTFLDLEKANTHMHVAATAVFESGPLACEGGGIDVDRLRDYVESRLELIPRYRQKLDWVPLEKHPVWVDDPHFNISYHVRHTCLPSPGSIDQLKCLAARVMSQQLDRDKPLWEFWVVEGLDQGKRFAVIQKAHHCMIDGLSGVDLMYVLMSPVPEQEFEKAGDWTPRPAPSPIQLLRDEMIGKISAPLQAAAGLPALLSSPLDSAAEFKEKLGAVAEAMSATMYSSSPTPFNAKIGPHRRFDWLAMDLRRIKEIKNRLGGTVNDVVLAIAAGAVGRFLEARGVDRRGLFIRANVPVSIREENQRGTLGNQIALWMADLPVGEISPVGRLNRVRETTRTLKQSKQVLGAQVLSSVSDMTSSTLLSLAVRLSTRSRPFNLVVTNVPGPQADMYMLGARLDEIYPMVNLLENQGLGVALFSYAGTLFWGVLGDWDLLPDLSTFVGGLAESFAELEQAALSS